MAYRMKMTAAEKAKQAKQNQRQRNQNRDDFRKSRDEKGAAARQRRKEAQEKARKVREKREAQKRARREQTGYNRASSQMAREVAGNEKPGFEGRANRFLDKATDGIGDAIRSGASAIGIDSDFDTGRMKARKEIKGYKKGGMAKKKKVGGGMNSGPLKPRSSKLLKSKNLSEAQRKNKEAKREFGDRGMSGYDQIKKVERDAATQFVDDENLIDQYGMDAPKARSFMTPKRNPRVKKLSAGGMAKKKPVKKNMGGMMKYNKGGNVRGAGMARSGRPCKMVTMKGS